MMRISGQGIALIKEFEGYSPGVYLCPGEKATIGYGHALLPGEEHLKSGITRQQAEALLLQDVRFAEDAVNAQVRTTLSQNQFDALVSFVYNVGVTAFSHSTLLCLLNENAMVAAAGQFSRWIYASDKKLPGLARRREAEYSLFIK